MKLAFYYHIPIFKINDKIKVPSYFAEFFESLAFEVDELYLFMHECNSNEEKLADTFLTGTNIHWINLGFKTHFLHRLIFHKKILFDKIKMISKCEILIVRAPSPLAPFFYKYISNQKIYFLIVGDYSEGIKHFKFNSLKYFPNLLMHQYFSRLFNIQISKTSLIVNSHQLYEKYKKVSKEILLIKTSTLSASDFFNRIDTCKNKNINLLYTGRLDLSKGLIELFKSVYLIRSQNYNVHLNIAGEDNSKGKIAYTQLVNLAKELNISDFINFHGWVPAGEKLNRLYRESDIYIIPSYHEGFPRTIWEALANSLPVIATEVGGIPYYLKDKHSAILIKPKDENEIVLAVIDLINDSNLRKKIILNGREIAKDAVNSIQNKKIISFIKN